MPYQIIIIHNFNCYSLFIAFSFFHCWRLSFSWSSSSAGIFSLILGIFFKTSSNFLFTVGHNTFKDGMCLSRLMLFQLEDIDNVNGHYNGVFFLIKVNSNETKNVLFIQTLFLFWLSLAFCCCYVVKVDLSLKWKKIELIFELLFPNPFKEMVFAFFFVDVKNKLRQCGAALLCPFICILAFLSVVWIGLFFKINSFHRTILD